MAAPTPLSGLSLTLKVSQVLQTPWWAGPEDTYIVDVHTVTPALHTLTARTPTCVQAGTACKHSLHTYVY